MPLTQHLVFFMSKRGDGSNRGGNAIGNARSHSQCNFKTMKRKIIPENCSQITLNVFHFASCSGFLDPQTNVEETLPFWSTLSLEFPSRLPQVEVFSLMAGNFLARTSPQFRSTFFSQNIIKKSYKKPPQQHHPSKIFACSEKPLLRSRKLPS